MNIIQNNMWNFRKQCCKGCLPDYTYGNYVYLNNIIDAHKKHNNKFTFNQEQDFHRTSLSGLMCETLILLPKLFVIKMIKNGWKNIY